ncbi:MAG: O-antigen ligase family protein [Chloroflexota bacterium]|nr:O-antigen ligase family protein [Chloroflexota bacterium]
MLLATVVVVVAVSAGAVVAAAPLIALATAAAALVVVACLAKPDVATYLALAILYSNAAAIAVQFHGLPGWAGLSMPLILAMPLGYHLVVRRQRVTVTAAFPFVVVYLLVAIASTALAANASSAFERLLVFLVGGFGLFFALTNALRTIEMVRNAVWVLMAVGAVVGALSVYQFVTRDYRNDFLGFAQVDLPGAGVTQFRASLEGIPRSEGPVGETNRYAQVMLVLLPLGMFVARADRRRWVKVVALVPTMLILLGVVATFSRGAAVAVAAMIVVAALFRYIRLIHVAALLLAGAAALAIFPSYADRLLDLQALAALDRTSGAQATVEGDASNLRGRVTHVLAAFYAFVDHPLLGVGPGQFGTHYQHYARAVADTAFDARIQAGEREPHNLYTGIAAELGMAGFVAFFGLIAVTMRDLLRARRRWLTERPDVAHLATAFWIALLGYLVSGIGLHLQYERYFWVLVALAAITAHLALRLEPRTDGGRTAVGRALPLPFVAR